MKKIRRMLNFPYQPDMIFSMFTNQEGMDADQSEERPALAPKQGSEDLHSTEALLWEGLGAVPGRDQRRGRGGRTWRDLHRVAGVFQQVESNFAILKSGLTGAYDLKQFCPQTKSYIN